MEALTAAVFLDQGWGTTTDFILRLFDTEIKNLAKQGIGIDYKSQLQHLVQSKQQETPVYHITESTGSEHDRIFTAEVRISNIVLGRDSGKSKKTAETEAARSALEQLK